MTRTPTILGSHGVAWRMDMIEDDLTRGGVAGWFVEVPHAHPAWRWYFVSAIHLRPVPGHDASLDWPTASHEIQVWACEDLDVGLGREAHRGKLLAPQNLVVQLEVATDDHAVQLTKDLVEAFVRGAVSPDTDWRTAQLTWLRERVRFHRAGPDRELYDTRTIEDRRRLS